MKQVQQPRLLWDFGTAYDLFASLHVLHDPEVFGLRGSWAAGVRSRLPAPQRSILEEAQGVFFTSPLGWVSSLPETRDATTALWALEKLAPADRIHALGVRGDESLVVRETLQEISARQAWTHADLEHLQADHQPGSASSRSINWVTRLEWWSHAGEYGERYLAAIQAYVEVFFAEEEKRIQPYLQQALENAQALARQLDFPALMVELSQGVKIAALEQADQVVFAPSYWTTPLVMYANVSGNSWLVLFGARPADVSLVPGEVVPDAMLRALKALSDPTRLLILRYLSDRPQTPSQLARRLRLRPPTVVHHLSALRLAGLVFVSMEPGEEKRYTVRKTAVKDAFESIQKFLSVKSES